MIELSQFLRWCGRKIWHFLTVLSSFFAKVPNSFRDSLRDEPATAIYLWILFTAVILLLSLLFVIPFKSLINPKVEFDAIIQMVIQTELSFSGFLLVVSGFRAIYSSFKKDQQNLLDILGKNSK